MHTWGQNLSQHFHLHCLVTGGALAADGSRWITGGSSILFPVRALATNDRLVEHRNGHGRFRWKDYADHDRVKILTLDADEFLRRFLLHVVPRGFVRIRHFGLLAKRTRRGTVARCRDLLGQPPPEGVPPESIAVLMQRLTGVDLSCCPVCGEGRMQITAIVVRVAPGPDTS